MFYLSASNTIGRFVIKGWHDLIYNFSGSICLLGGEGAVRWDGDIRMATGRTFKRPLQ